MQTCEFHIFITPTSPDQLSKCHFQDIFISSTKLVFEIKELLHFQRPRPLEILVKFRKEQNNGEWSVDKAFSILIFLTDSCILLEINK